MAVGDWIGQGVTGWIVALLSIGVGDLEELKTLSRLNRQELVHELSELEDEGVIEVKKHVSVKDRPLYFATLTEEGRRRAQLSAGVGEVLAEIQRRERRRQNMDVAVKLGFSAVMAVVATVYLVSTILGVI